MKIKLSSKCFIEQFEDESIILNIETNKYHSINDCGAKIIDVLGSESMSFDELKTKIDKFYSGLNSQEIDTFIKNMLDRKIFIES